MIILEDSVEIYACTLNVRITQLKVLINPFKLRYIREEGVNFAFMGLIRYLVNNLFVVKLPKMFPMLDVPLQHFRTWTPPGLISQLSFQMGNMPQFCGHYWRAQFDHEVVHFTKDPVMTFQDLINDKLETMTCAADQRNTKFSAD